MLLADEPNIREVILFPLNQQGEDPMMGAPAPVEAKRLKELSLQLDLPPVKTVGGPLKLGAPDEHAAGSAETGRRGGTRGIRVMRVPRRAAIAASLASLMLATSGGAALAASLAAHRATYELSLDHVERRRGGRRHRPHDLPGHGYLLRLGHPAAAAPADGHPRRRPDQRWSPTTRRWRARTADHLTFDMHQRANGATTEQVRGEATMPAPGPGPGGGSIGYVLPHRATVALPAGTLFPMAHTLAILQAAEAGRKSLSPLLFDGTGPDGAQDTYVVITGWQPAPSQSDRAGSLAALGSAQVHVAFFSRAPGTISPDYEAAMRYFSNGVSDRVLMDFGTFTMKATMQDFVLAKPAHC